MIKLTNRPKFISCVVRSFVETIKKEGFLFKASLSVRTELAVS